MGIAIPQADSVGDHGDLCESDRNAMHSEQFHEFNKKTTENIQECFHESSNFPFFFLNQFLKGFFSLFLPSRAKLV